MLTSLIQATDRDRNECLGPQVQRWNHDGSRQPWYSGPIKAIPNIPFDQKPLSSASYGSLARFKDVQRLHPVGDHTVIGAGGDMSDFQYIQSFLDELMIDEFAAQDGHTLGPAEIHEYLHQVMYGRRSKMDPLWNALLVGGFKDGKRYVFT
jgi:hypothetical protein